MAIDQSLIDKCQSDLEDFGSLMKCHGTELLNNYIKLIEDNAQLYKDNATLRNRLKVLESS